jgi:Xaa-Pro aminopeptidase
VGTYQDHSTVQQAAKRVLNVLGPTLTSCDSEATIAARAVDLLSAEGIADTWYYDCPAFVLLGSRSCLSISGRDYVPSLEQVGDFNLITVDLSPLLNGAWGDCARTFVIEGGAFVPTPALREFSEGLAAEAALHAAMLAFVEPTTTFVELSAFGNSELRRLGFENLDLHGNLGHSIESQRESRIYIESGNRRPLGSVPFFTFEPHIRKVSGTWGFKHEEIYCFDSQHRPHAL